MWAAEVAHILGDFMKLKLLHDLKVAHPILGLPMWDFKKDEVVETDNEYLISTLVDPGHAKPAKKEKEAKGERKMKSPPKNKMMDAKLNKSEK